MTDEAAIILSEGGADKKRLRFSLKEYQGVPLLDIRYFYRDRSGEFAPTRKGISISRNRYLDFHNVISKHHEAISSFLEGGGGAVSIGREEKELASRNVSSVERVEATVESFAGPDLYDVRYEGSTAKVKLDAKHACVQGAVEGSSSTFDLARFFVAFDIAATLVSDSESYEVIDAVERLGTELIRQLSNLSLVND